MKEQIERTLYALVGKELWGAGRSLNLFSFQFGERVPRMDSRADDLVGEFALHIQCAWRITGPNTIIVGSDDYLYPPGDPFDEPSGFDPDKPGTTRCDALLNVFFDENSKDSLLITAVWADNVGGLRLHMQGNYTLECFPDDSLDHEHWRFFQPGTDHPHFVVTGAGLE